ncbi:MAG TPA: TonB-dependent receptor [Steroidobacteraceae bacterium]|nr:TonB-dependent receptor [Steroidobacteraceae bacterium]
MRSEITAALILTCAASQMTADAAEVEEVLVTAPGLEESLPEDFARYGTRVETIAAPAIENGGYDDVGQTLQAIAPGLYLAPRAGAFDYVDLSFQGSRTGDVLWLIDGVRLNNRLYNSTTPIDTIPAHVVERIEVLEGGQGLTYGTQAVAGVVNIVTKAFSERPDGAFELGLDENDGRHLNGYFRNTLGSHRFVLYGSKDEADGFQPFRDSDFQPSATDRERGYDVRTLGGKYAHEFGSAVRVSAMYQQTDAKLDHAQPRFIAEAVNEREEDILSVKLDYTASEAFQLFVKGYYHWWDAYYSETDNDPATPGVPEVVSDREFWGFEDYGLNVLAKLAAGKHVEYLVGYDFQRYTGEDDVLLIARQAESVHAPFAQLRTTPALFPKLRLAAGVRRNEPEHGAAATVWNASGHWDITDKLFLRGAAGTAFRLPDAYELFAIDPCCEAGNPNLEPEESEHLNLSIGGIATFGSARVSWEVVAFARDVTNLITIVFDPTLGLDTFANVDDTVKVRGLELVVGATLSEAFAARASFTSADATAVGSSQQIQDIPESHIKLALDYAPKQRPFGASLTVNHVGNVYRNLGIGRQEFGNYAVVDVAGRVFLDHDRRHRVGLRVENCLDEEYATRVRQTVPDGGGAPYAYWHLGTPRTVHASYTYEF